MQGKGFERQFTGKLNPNNAFILESTDEK